MAGEVTIRLKGGLGNQLFMYFAGANLARSLDVPLKLDISQLRNPKQARMFELEYLKMPVPYSVVSSGVNFRNRYAARIFNVVLDFYCIFRGYTIWRPKSLGYEPHTKRGSKIILDGYFQSFRYVEELTEKIGSFNLFDEESAKEGDSLPMETEDCISVHVRRTDFLPLAHTIGVLDRRYYFSAISRALNIYPGSKIVFFGDDFQFLLDLQKVFPNSIIPEMDFNLSTKTILKLISSSKCIVSSNSTFSWWASYLSNNSVLIFPKDWHRDHEVPDLLFKKSITLLPAVWE